MAEINFFPQNHYILPHLIAKPTNTRTHAQFAHSIHYLFLSPSLSQSPANGWVAERRSSNHCVYVYPPLASPSHLTVFVSSHRVCMYLLYVYFVSIQCVYIYIYTHTLLYTLTTQPTHCTLSLSHTHTVIRAVHASRCRCCAL